MTTLEPYTGAYFTLRYADMKSRTDIDFAAVFDRIPTLIGGFSTKHPYFIQNKGTIIERAELEYMYREINAETPDMWLRNAMRCITELADRYEPALKREADTSFDASSVADAKSTTTYGSKVDNLLQDTPYGELDDDADYTSSQSHTKRGGSDSVEAQTGMDAEKLDRLRKTWDSTINMIIKDLGDLFMHTIAMDVIL